MDPVTLETVTTALSFVGHEVAKGSASEAGKALWKKVRDLLGWKSDPPEAAIPQAVAQGIVDQPDLLEKLLSLVEKQADSGALAIVQNLRAKNAFVAREQTFQNPTFQ
jgi:hypothetical protein